MTEDTEATTWFQRNMHFRMDCYHMERNEEEVTSRKELQEAAFKLGLREARV